MTIEAKGAITGALPAPNSNQANNNSQVFCILFQGAGAANVTLGGAVVLSLVAGQSVFFPPSDFQQYGIFDPTKFATSAAVNVTYFLP